MSRVAGYIDGFNLYYGLKSRNWRQFYWIDPYKLIQALLAPGDRLVAVKYFTARVKGDEDKRRRQGAFLDAIRAASLAETIHGKYYRKPRRCRCGCCKWTEFEEKMTDSAIASNLVADAFRDQFDTAFLVGGDTDIVPAIKMVRKWHPGKRLVVWFPPARANQEVELHCHDSGMITGDHLQAALLPKRIEVDAGVFVECPKEWAASTSAPD